MQMEAGESSCEVPKSLQSIGQEDMRPAFMPAPSQGDIYAVEWMNQEHNYKLEQPNNYAGEQRLQRNRYVSPPEQLVSGSSYKSQ
jgi:hypothetical protein